MSPTLRVPGSFNQRTLDLANARREQLQMRGLESQSTNARASAFEDRAAASERAGFGLLRGPKL